MFDRFIQKNGIKIVNSVFEDYLGTQFFPSLNFANDTFDYDRINNIYGNISNNNNLKNLYIHIPFCKTRCTYCHCYTSLEGEESYEKYISYLFLEIEKITEKIGKRIKIDSIFIGGGTPNIIGTILLEKLLYKINDKFNLINIKQFNIDLNPYFLDNETISVLSKYGVNRCTYAIQSFDKEILRKNSRFYDEKVDHKKNINTLRENDIHVNIDLMVGINSQTLKSCILDIKYAKELNADNISLNYFIQSNNVHYKIDDKKIKLINDVKKYYNSYIYKTYNIDPNFQEESYLSNKVDLIGVGNGSISHIYGKVIFYNMGNIDNYYNDIDNSKGINKKVKYLEKKDEMIKFIWLNLIYKINLEAFKKTFGENILDVFGEEIKYLESKKIIYLGNDYIEPKVSNFKLYLHLSIILKDYLVGSNLNNNIVFLKENIKRFFLKNGEKIDEDY